MNHPDHLLLMFHLDHRERIQKKLLPERQYNALAETASGKDAAARYAGVQRDLQDLTAAYLVMAEALERFVGVMDRVTNLEMSLDILERIQKMLPKEHIKKT